MSFSFAAVLYIVLGIASFALVAFFAWATWNGGKKESPGDVPDQPGPPPAPPTETGGGRPASGPAGRV